MRNCSFIKLRRLMIHGMIYYIQRFVSFGFIFVFSPSKYVVRRGRLLLLFMEYFLSYPDLNECICLKKDSEATEEIVLIIQKA